MPQMAPLWWEILFIMFMITFMMFNIMIYFNSSKNINKKNSLNKKSLQLNWMW
uniref:ATP synthase complex subunit 8 n=1 Tax=Eurydema maracandica TaxID=1380459 RepID=A0A343U7T7_9HEMI|nr:ATP synthase F0 subunit 8 [Eurydema maracandica]AUZ97275.1 ATP synthase F0 subunit 8 [Eurydema maracandica]